MTKARSSRNTAVLGHINVVMGVVACLWFACGTESASNQGREPIHLDGGTSQADSGTVLSPCGDNTDCQGGEVCRDGLCREACSEEDPCEGPWTACDLDQGYCVECLADDECDFHEACTDNSCVFFCRDSSVCSDTQHCDIASGECLEQECTDDPECDGGFRCIEYECVPIDDIVCEPDSLECDGNVLVVCSADGTAADRFECGDERQCVSGGSAARCLTIVCIANEAGCLSTSRRFSCDETGTFLTEADCEEEHYCDEGSCLEQVCDPSTDLPACEGGDVWGCDSRGASLVVVDECDDENEVCNEDSCVPLSCEAGSSRCSGDVLQECSEDGLDLTTTNCRESEAYCDSESPACQPWICEPGSTDQCTDSTVRRCNSTGSALETVAECGPGGCLNDVECWRLPCEDLDQYGNDASTIILDHLDGSTLGTANESSFSTEFTRFGSHSLYLDTGDSKVTYGSSTDANAEGTVEVWFMPTEIPLQRKIVTGTNRPGTGCGGCAYFHIGFSATEENRGRIYGKHLEAEGGWHEVLLSNARLVENRWYHIAYSWGPGGVELLINGVVEASSDEPSSLDPKTGRFGLGSVFTAGCCGGGEQSANGYYDEFRLSSTTRPAVCEE